MGPFRMLAFATLLALLQQQPRDGSVEITLRDSLNHKGIPAVRVTLVLLTPPNSVTTLFTDSEGKIAARNLTYGNYVLRIEPGAYRMPVRNPLADSSSVTLSISPDAPTYRFETELNPIATLTGRVLYSNGDPFPNAEISLLSKRYRNGQATLSTAEAGGTTDDRGVFRFAGVLPGDYYIRIRNSDSEHLPRFTYYPGVTDSALAIPVAVRGIDLAVDTRLPREPVFRISGTVVSPMPIRAGAFSLASANPDSLEDAAPSRIPVELSDPNEFSFEIAGIPPGRYFFYPRINTENGDVINKIPVNVADRDIENLRITMQPSVELRGRIIFDGDRGGAGWESVKVATLPVDRLPITLQGRDIVGVGVSGGEFVLQGLIPDARFAVRVLGMPPGGYVSDVLQGGRSVYREGFIRSNPSEGSLEIHVDARGGTITGTVGDTLNQAAKQIAVIVVPDAPRRANSQLYKRAITDANGAFTLRGIPPGEYQLFAWTVAPPEGAEQDARFLAPYEGKGTIVRVTRGGTTEAKLRLLPL